jgi:hypothetical protein
MAYKGGAEYARAFHVLYGIAAVAFVVCVLLLAKPTQPDPPNSKAFGCYTSAQAAPILLNQQGMSILQPGEIKIRYHLERHKTGIALTADAPIAAERVGNRYVFSITPPGVGWYLDFFNVINGESYGVFDENALQQFTMLARDGNYLPYRKGPERDCQL